MEKAKKSTVCVECEHHDLLKTWLPHRHMCYVFPGVDYVTGEKTGVPCSKKNSEGNCPDFKEFGCVDPPDLGEYPNAKMVKAL